MNILPIQSIAGDCCQMLQASKAGCSNLQISIGGLEHGLTPLAEACPAVHVIEAPTEFLGALWLPYRRQRAELDAALQASGPAKAIFAHADVVRAHPSKRHLSACTAVPGPQRAWRCPAGCGTFGSQLQRRRTLQMSKADAPYSSAGLPLVRI